MSSLARLPYLSQLRLLRQLAAGALLRYPIGQHKLSFINHGENTTFRVDTARQGRFLLRIHRHNYHSKEALTEELSFLRHLGNRGLSVPLPVSTKSGRSLVHVSHDAVPEGRYCDLLRWVEGRFIDESVSEKHMFSLGCYMGQLRKLGKGKVYDHRRYWHAEGLVGKAPKFGSIDHLPGIAPGLQRRLSAGRRLVLGKLRAFEQRFPDRQGMIHADMHFGNFLVKKGGEISGIDFDDCGFGFYAYELVVPLTQLEHMATGKRFERLRAFLLEGYASAALWDEHDQRILPYLLMARKLLMLGWRNSRSNIPGLRKLLPKVAASIGERLKELRE